MLSRLVDVAITIFITAIIFMIFVLPRTLDIAKIEENGITIAKLYNETGLFIVDKAGNYNGKSAFQNVKKIDDLYSVSCDFNGKTYENVSLTESLYLYYTTKFVDYGNQYNLTFESYQNDILKIGSVESNIKEYDAVNNRLILLDNNKEDVTINYFLNVYSSACKNVISNSKIAELTNENRTIVFEGISSIIPVLLIVSFVFEFMVPLFSPCSETIGKHIFRLGVLSHDGYRLKKIWLLPRWLCYIFIEFILGILTFGATLLITYTMFLFCKKRRCLHDFFAKTIVIEKYGSIYFASSKEENYYKQHYGEGDDYA